jgi:hypothetical protein
LLCCWDAGIPEDEFGTNGDICIECWNKKPSADVESPNQESAPRSFEAKSTAASSKKASKTKKKRVELIITNTKFKYSQHPKVKKSQ